MPVKSQNAAHPVVGACGITRCRTHLDELSTTCCATFCACTGPVGTVRGAVYAECGGQTWPKNLIQTNIQPYRENNSRNPTLLHEQYAIRYEEAFFSLENQEKKARRCALRSPHYNCWDWAARASHSVPR